MQAIAGWQEKLLMVRPQIYAVGYKKTTSTRLSLAHLLPENLSSINRRRTTAHWYLLLLLIYRQFGSKSKSAEPKVAKCGRFLKMLDS